MIPRQDSLEWPIRGNVGLRPQRGTFDRFSAVPDPGHKIRGGGGGGGRGKMVSKEFFSALWASLWSIKKKEGGGQTPPGSSPGSVTVRSYESAKISLVEIF